MQAAQTRLNASASNIANVGTGGFRRQEVAQAAQPEGGVSASDRRTHAEGFALETDLTAQLQAKNAFLANLTVFKTNDQMAGVLLDTKA
jgi:flagellar hook protein FlgE